MKAHSEKFKKQRKFLLVFPLLVLPFITMAFWALGGGQGSQKPKEKAVQKGLNTKLPQAKLPSNNLDKMSLYHIAEQDDQALQEARKKDPYADFKDTATTVPITELSTSNPKSYYPDYTSTKKLGGRLRGNKDPNAIKVQRKLNELEKALNSAPDTNLFATTDLPAPEMDKNTQTGIKNMQQILNSMEQNPKPDPELQQLDAMLEKILDIQHPKRVRKELKAKSEKELGRVFPVISTFNKEKVPLLKRPFIPFPDGPSLPVMMKFRQNAFYDLSQSVIQKELTLQAVPAVIHETQTLVSGATVKLRLMQDVYINGVLIPKNTFVFGVGKIAGERLKITIKNIRYGKSILPVSLSVYDMDGLEGIRIPGAITRDVAKQHSGQALQNMQFMSLNPSLGTQAAGAGIEAAKGLIHSKAKRIRVTIKAGYQVLLVDQKATQQ